jgi:hypothetical protein
MVAMPGMSAASLVPLLGVRVVLALMRSALGVVRPLCFLFVFCVD